MANRKACSKPLKYGALHPGAEFALEGDEVIAWRAPGAEKAGPPPPDLQAALTSMRKATRAAEGAFAEMTIDLALAEDILALNENADAPAPIARRVADQLNIPAAELAQTAQGVALRTVAAGARHLRALVALDGLVKSDA